MRQTLCISKKLPGNTDAVAGREDSRDALNKRFL